VNREIRELRTLWNWARSMGLTRSNPVEGVKPLRVVFRLRRTLIPDECRLLVSTLPPLLADLLVLIGGTGVRLGEGTHLWTADVLLDERAIELRSRPDYKLKDREERKISNLSDPVMDVLRRRMLAAGGRVGPLFVTRHGKLIRHRNALRDIKAAAAKAGLKNPREVNWQMLRRSFASYNAQFMSEWGLQSLLGHSNPKTTSRHYVHGVTVTPRPLTGG
jgi:integrase